MLDIRCMEHVEKCREFAKTLSPEAVQSLERCLSRYDDDDRKLVRIVEERMSPYSFYFNVYTRTDFPGKDTIEYDGKFWRYWYNGGYIFWEGKNIWQIHT